MKLISWNVNGIRAIIKKGFHDFLQNEKPDILCLQEIKISHASRKAEKDKAGINFPGYLEFWNSAERPGYSGTAILVREDKKVLAVIGKKQNVRNGIGVSDFDKEGRVQTLECKDYCLINAYYPNANHELSRLDYKLDFNVCLLKYIKKLEKKKPVIVTGDYNVAHEPIDLARPKENVGNPGFTDEERESMAEFLKAGFIDTFRYLHPKKVQYTWWSYRAGARRKNIGWRIDYFCLSNKLKTKIKKASILDAIEGSDHCPIELDV